MKKKNFNVFKRGLSLLTLLAFIVIGCNTEPLEDGTAEVAQAEAAKQEEAKANQIDEASEVLDDIAIDVFESVEASGFIGTTKTPNGVNSFHPTTIPECVTITITLQQNFKRIVIDFGTEGCEIKGNILKGKIILSYEKNVEAKQILITKSLEDFYFNELRIEGSKTILRERSNDNGNPQFTKTTNIVITWPDGTEASRDGLRIREWIEGHGSGIQEDNVFLVTGHWISTFKNGNTHSYVVVEPLRREATCRFFVSGTVEITRPNVSGVLDFGDGTCDDLATFTTADGVVTEIELGHHHGDDDDN